MKLSLTHIEGVMDVADEQAPYNRLLSVLTEQFGLQFDAQFYPSGRSNFLLDHGKIDCIFPIAKGVYRGEIETRFLEPVNRVSVHLFSYGDTTYTSLEQVRRKTVVYPQGYLFSNLINDNPFEADFTPVLTPHSGMEMLKKGRADAYLDYLPDLRFSLTAEELEGINYSSGNAIFSTFDGFECRIEPHKTAALEALNSAILSLKQSQQLQSILGNYYNL
ncbi:transporter substrate-binding domain-containing protein [Planctobacterium marinum]|uniref:substrate-binding periplasmic protein n=1 Tax=Planctobacterium marinum TaxID=1631968 RepID=UPI0030C76090